MTTVRAAVLHEVGAPFVVEEITLEPVGPRYVRVKMAASGVCHSDLSVQNGTLPFMFPTVLGHEGSGVVAEIGSDVTRVAVGDHVVLTWMPPCRQCFWCLHQQPMLCNVGMGESIGGPYGTVISGILGTNTGITGLTAGQTYYIIVTAVDAFGQSLGSSQIAVSA